MIRKTMMIFMLVFLGLFVFGNNLAYANNKPIILCLPQYDPSKYFATVNITLEDDTGLSYVLFPDGTKKQLNGVTYSQTTYVINQNGNYTFTVADKNGATSYQYITISGLVKNTAPSLTYSLSTTALAPSVTITVKATDSDGIDYILKPNNTKVYSSSTTYKVTSNGSYKFYAYDKYGLSKSITVSVSNIGTDFEFVNYTIKDAQTHEVSTRGIKNRDYYLEIEIKNNCTCGEEHYYGGSGIIMDEDGTPYIMAMTDPVYIESGGTYFDKFYFNMYDDEWYPDSANLSIVLFALEPDIDNSNNEVDDFYWSYGTEYVDFGIVSAIVRSAATDEIVTQTYTGEDYYIDFEIENNSDTEETLEHIGFLGSDSDLIFWDYLENITIKNGENYIGKYYFTSSKTAGSNDNLMGIYLYLPDDGDAQNNEFTIALPFGTRYSDFSVDNITVKDSRSGNVVYELYAGRDYYFEVTITNHSNDSSNNIVPSLYIMAGFEDDEHSSPDSIIYTTDEYIVESGTTETFIFDFKAITSYPIISSSRLDITALINTSGAIKEDQNVSNNEMTIEVPLLGVLGIELTYSLSTNGDTNSPITITYKPSSTSGPIKGVKLPDGSTVNKSSGTYSVSKNGTYTFVAFDEFGYTYEMKVIIDTIDYGKPIIILEKDPNSEWSNQDVTVTMEYSDT